MDARFFVTVANHHPCVSQTFPVGALNRDMCAQQQTARATYIESNPLINVHTILSDSIQPVNGKAARDIMFCIRPLKPLPHTDVCLCHFDHIDIVTSEVIPNLFWGLGLKMISLSEKSGACYDLKLP